MAGISDTEGDGEAGQDRTVGDDLGMTGNDHEFAFGPARDAHGNLFVGLNLASSGASLRPELRGEFRHYGLSREGFKANSYGKASGRMYAATPYRGWVLNITPEGKMTPFAPGLRSTHRL